MNIEHVNSGHIGEPKDCYMCKVSTRPNCPHCGHSLSGDITQPENKTICEVCGSVTYIPKPKKWADVLKRGQNA